MGCIVKYSQRLKYTEWCVWWGSAAVLPNFMGITLKRTLWLLRTSPNLLPGLWPPPADAFPLSRLCRSVTAAVGCDFSLKNEGSIYGTTEACQLMWNQSRKQHFSLRWQMAVASRSCAWEWETTTNQGCVSYIKTRHVWFERLLITEQHDFK